jgi:hypothetical protein
MSQTQLPSSERTNRARLALGFSDPVSVEISEADLGRPWREVALEALAGSDQPDGLRLADVLGAPSDFQFERAGEYLASDSTTQSVLGRDAGESNQQDQGEEPLVRVMRRQRGGACAA